MAYKGHLSLKSFLLLPYIQSFCMDDDLLILFILHLLRNVLVNDVKVYHIYVARRFDLRQQNINFQPALLRFIAAYFHIFFSRPTTMQKSRLPNRPLHGLNTNCI